MSMYLFLPKWIWRVVVDWIVWIRIDINISLRFLFCNLHFFGVCVSMAMAMAMTSRLQLQNFERWRVVDDNRIFHSSKPTTTNNQQPPQQQIKQRPISRRLTILISVLPLSFISLQSLARERRNRKTIPLEDYLTSSDGLKYYDVLEGKGPSAEKGTMVQVHFDCLYRGITAVSSRESKLLAGNRIIAQPYEFQVGAPPGKERKREFVDNPNGLFSAQAAPKPPMAMYTITEGMKVGGKRTVIVPPEAGYGKKGMNEIPPGATFDLNIELLEVIPSEK